jgi:predicted nucleic-acid-binding protein
MYGIDTNVLVRFITQDDPAQAAIATEFFERRFSVDTPGFVSVVALAETWWVLRRSYRFSAAAVAEAIERVLQMDNLVIEREQDVFIAMIAAKEGRGEFADALIGALNLRAGCECTLSFDRHALRLPGFIDPSQI